MTTIKINLSKPFQLSKAKEKSLDIPDKGGIYFHCIIKKDNLFRIIYVGKCESFKSRQIQHLSYYEKNKYTLFLIENEELDIKYIPYYDIEDKVSNFNKIKDENINNVYVIFGEIVDPENNTFEAVEGAIINYLFRKSSTRKFLLSIRTNYSLRDKVIEFLGQEKEVMLLGLEDRKINVP